MTVRLQVQHYITQKIEADRKDCQDAIAFNCVKGCFAVADGATEAYGSRYWSRLLAKSWVRFRSTTDVTDFMELSAALGERAHLHWGSKTLPWYAEEKLKAGSFAAFVGLTLQAQSRRIVWKAISIGDSCLIQRRRGAIISAIPLSDPSQFTYRPTLLPSLHAIQHEVTTDIEVYQGYAETEDVFLLMSDAVACWYLGAVQRSSTTVVDFEQLLSAGHTERMDIFIDDRRLAAEMKDDDVSAIYIKILGQDIL